MSNNDKKTESEPQIVCHCSGTTRQKIHELMAKGVDNLDRIADITGAATGCGSCDAEITDILQQKSNNPRAD